MSADGELIARPVGVSIYTDELADEIVEVVGVSPRSLEWLCARNAHWPSVRTLWSWRDKNPGFRNAFDEARRRLADELAFQAIEIADDDDGDVMELTRKDGSTYLVVNQAKVQRDKERSANRRWLAGKLAPEVYGERLDVNARLGPILSQEDALDQLR